MTNFSGFVASQVAGYVPIGLFPLGIHQDKVFMKKTNNVVELKVAITDLINGIPQKMLKKLFGNLQHWVKTCLENDGGHFVMYKKNIFFSDFLHYYF